MSARTQGREEGKQPTSSLRFLIVEDQVSARKMLRQAVLGNPAWSVAAEAATGLEAVAEMRHEPEVVLMDVVMSVMDGLEATRQIKSLAPDTIIILTTAYQNHVFRARSLEAGADGFILKDDLTTEALQEVIADTRAKGDDYG